ncbi:MCE family protein [Mycobacterium sp. NAZ190054]|uniref:MCE family protein n=1 Tax=Mycobacterium sp. NAZ190054 TaxID=1747766 RepID=UPI00079B7325|nr:MlaD family protein [Mycobacterium sp. NAZ190054]KWX69243.1 hypothetical protein ASJ79_00120 [Mycobacterium sp. NAZ190054]
MLTRFVRIQLAVFTIVGVIGLVVMFVQYMQVQSIVGIGRVTVTMQLPVTGGLYRYSNVTYRGVQVGRVTDVALDKSADDLGVTATLSLTSTTIPADLHAQVRSVSAAGEVYVDLRPETDSAPYLRDGSVILADRVSLPQPVGPVLDNVSRLVGTFPKDSLHTLIDETYRSVNGAQYDMQFLIDSATTIAGDFNTVGDQSRKLIQDADPLLDSQARTVDDIRTWTRSLAGATDQLVVNDPQVRTLLTTGPGTAQEVSRLLDQLNPTLPVLLANLTTVGQLAVTYNPSLEQVLVLYPPLVAAINAAAPDHNPTGMAIASFRIQISDPPACTVGFLPPSEWRPGYETDTVDTPDDLYCKLPQDSPIAVRGVRNFPCVTKPGKRAPSAAICNSDEEYEPLAQRNPPVGPYPRDPNLEAQGIPPDTRWFPDQGLYAPPGQGPSAPPPPAGAPPPAALPVPDLPRDNEGSLGLPPPPAPPPMGPAPQDPSAVVPVTPNSLTTAAPPGPSAAVAGYNPRTGEYVGPDGQLYRQSELIATGEKRTWQDLVLGQ